MRYPVVLVYLVVLYIASGLAQLPTCSTTSCVSDVDCPSFKDSSYVPKCVAGACTNGYLPPTQLLGQTCNTSDSSERCRSGFCDVGSASCQNLVSNGCQCTADEQCEGGLCLGGSCDSLRNINDPCTINEHCGSVCVDGRCALGNIGDKCNSHDSCDSGLCDITTLTCVKSEHCSPQTPTGSCPPGSGTTCIAGGCYGFLGAEGSMCDSSISAPQCKISLSCVNNVCSKVPEGTPCSSHDECSPLQECVCSGSSGNLGCYSKINSNCVALYQDMADCLSSGRQCSDDISQFECCVGCARDSQQLPSGLSNMKGSCGAKLEKTDCCLSTMTCEATTNDVCANTYTKANTNSAPSLQTLSTFYILFATLLVFVSLL